MRSLLRGILNSALWLGWSCLAFAGQDGLLIINVDLMRLNEQGSQTNVLDGISSYSVLNLNTRRSYRFAVISSAKVDAEEVEEGIYCLSSVSLLNMEVSYCGEPYFRVV